METAKRSVLARGLSAETMTRWGPEDLEGSETSLYDIVMVGMS